MSVPSLGPVRVDGGAVDAVMEPVVPDPVRVEKRVSVDERCLRSKEVLGGGDGEEADSTDALNERVLWLLDGLACDSAWEGPGSDRV